MNDGVIIDDHVRAVGRPKCFKLDTNHVLNENLYEELIFAYGKDGIDDDIAQIDF